MSDPQIKHFRYNATEFKVAFYHAMYVYAKAQAEGVDLSGDPHDDWEWSYDGEIWGDGGGEVPSFSYGTIYRWKF